MKQTTKELLIVTLLYAIMLVVATFGGYCGATMAFWSHCPASKGPPLKGVALSVCQPAAKCDCDRCPKCCAACKFTGTPCDCPSKGCDCCKGCPGKKPELPKCCSEK